MFFLPQRRLILFLRCYFFYERKIVDFFSPNGLNFHNRNANGLRCAIALHNCLKGRTFIAFNIVLSCLSGRDLCIFVPQFAAIALTAVMKIIAFQAKC